jgi:hypothetical protein
MQSRVFQRLHHIISTIHPHASKTATIAESQESKSVQWVVEENKDTPTNTEAYLYFTNLIPQCWHVCTKRTLI